MMPRITKDRLLTSLHISLRDKNNGTYRGNLVLKNWTVIQGDYAVKRVTQQVTTSKPNELVDPVGASYYVIAVVLVYGMSIVALIASHIKRKHGKVIEDRQINKYLREFQTVKDLESRESYKNLKKRIKEQINWEKPHSKTQNTLHQNLSHALLPMIAIGVSVPQLQPTNSISNLYWQRSRSNSIFNSQNSIYVPRSRTSSVGSTTSMPASVPSVHPGDRSPALLRPERKRGMANILSGIHNQHDFPLEKILEESMSRENSVRRKSSLRKPLSEEQNQAEPQLFNPNEVCKNLEAYKQTPNSETLPHIHTDIGRGSTSELGSSMDVGDTPSPHPYGSTLGDSGMGRGASPTLDIELGESAVTHMEKLQQQQLKSKSTLQPIISSKNLKNSRPQPGVHFSAHKPNVQLLLQPPPKTRRALYTRADQQDNNRLLTNNRSTEYSLPRNDFMQQSTEL